MCDKTPPTRVSLHPAQAPRQARRAARATLCREHAGLADAAVELIASELVTDALKHGSPPIELTLECQVTEVLVSVTDRGHWAAPPEGGHEELTWVLVDKIARSWGVEPTGSGRLLWCSVPSGELPSGRPVRGGRRMNVKLADNHAPG